MHNKKTFGGQHIIEKCGAVLTKQKSSRIGQVDLEAKDFRAFRLPENEQTGSISVNVFVEESLLASRIGHELTELLSAIDASAITVTGVSDTDLRRVVLRKSDQEKTNLEVIKDGNGPEPTCGVIPFFDFHVSEILIRQRKPLFDRRSYNVISLDLNWTPWALRFGWIPESYLWAMLRFETAPTEFALPKLAKKSRKMSKITDQTRRHFTRPVGCLEFGEIRIKNTAKMQRIAIASCLSGLRVTIESQKRETVLDIHEARRENRRRFNKNLHLLFSS